MSNLCAHDLKTWPEHFAAVASGAKRAEIRRCDDRTFAVGDVLRLREWIQPSNYDEVGGPLVVCVVCGRAKSPRGRSAPLEMVGCDWDCPGYSLEPRAGDLWPGERRSDFGYGFIGYGFIDAGYTGRELRATVTHVLLGATWQGHPAAVLSIEVEA
jgi:hypothetical protein